MNKLIEKWESFRSRPYQDVGGVWTIGYGTTHYPDGTDVKETDPQISQAKGAEYVQDWLDHMWKDIIYLMPPLTSNQKEAIESLIYNIGVQAFKKSKLLQLLSQGNDTAAAEQFMRWNKVGKKEVKGLTNRRWDERKTFLTPVFVEITQAPQRSLWKKLKECFNGKS